MTKTSFCLFVAQLGILGKAPIAPGTVATIVAGIPSAGLLGLVGLPTALLLVALLFIVGCYAADAAETELQKTDPSEVVIDELIGFLITIVGFPFTPLTLALGIAGFRLLDIWKPWPVSALDARLKGGVGIVVDDVAAGVLARLLVWAGLEIWG
jgi:phosphatidylglycerophosphatase A